MFLGHGGGMAAKLLYNDLSLYSIGISMTKCYDLIKLGEGM